MGLLISLSSDGSTPSCIIMLYHYMKQGTSNVSSNETRLVAHEAHQTSIYRNIMVYPSHGKQEQHGMQH
jgi:hypothetical protein